MASRAEDTGGGTAMVRQSSSSSCASSRSSFSNLGQGAPPFAANAPYLTVMKTQLNFFMTRLLFMQEEKADSLGARRERRMNNSMNGSGNMNMSGSFNTNSTRLDNQPAQAQQAEDHGNLLGPMMEPDELSTDDICVFNDNARILPNSRAKSFPAVPFPPTAPESPRPVEGKEGVLVVAPTHRPASPKSNGSTVVVDQLPEALPLSDMALEDRTKKAAEEDELPPLEQQHDDEEEDTVMEEMMEAEQHCDSSSPQDETDEDSAEDAKPKARASAAAVPTGARVFPKNQRRSKRYSTVKRSQSDVSEPDDAGKMGGSAH
ncbi:expressed unknown protein [Seminavis robusta]|uniref:Uncharacterized protein n=1 Tax=Seminavis robusta TaxID=568900 RepID=A0A9N8HLA7_9STRA|nr:expressed unknown protein [Seminavis robusta]|eukprot:Sro796_g203690.1 n/a (318) ;mRNA; f:12787-13740